MCAIVCTCVRKLTALLFCFEAEIFVPILYVVFTCVGSVNLVQRELVRAHHCQRV